ncbi:MAG: hypothetical protein ABF310_08645 [Paracoccaceae bacterium]|jgi:hypothetical protein
MKRILFLICVTPLALANCGMSDPVKSALYDKEGVTGSAPGYHAQATFDAMPRPTITPEDITEHQEVAQDLLDHTPILDE